MRVVYFSTQFHPEHMGGPRDLECLFDVFLNQVILHKRGQNRYCHYQLKQVLMIIPVLQVYCTVMPDILNFCGP